jgi:5'-phosphate synthase pdxT subunit
MVKVGIIALQGAVSEHIEITNRALAELGLSGCAIEVRRPEALRELTALIIPGGESTTISRMMLQTGLFDTIIKLGADGVPILGTCAGAILLAQKGDEEVEKSGTHLLSLMTMSVRRNAFGRQRESFEAEITIEGLEQPFRAAFIRAPAITGVWDRCKVVAKLETTIVMARQENMFAVTFHPELTGDLRIHKMFLQDAKS